MQVPNVSTVLALLYTDRMTVYHYHGTTDADGALCTTLDTVPILKDIPCRVSFSQKDSPATSDDRNPTKQRPLLICDIEVPLRRGDFIMATRREKEICSGRIGRPNPYGSSQQALFDFEEDA